MFLLLVGQFAIGLVAGLFTGLSQTPVVGAIVPAILAFGSGSVIGLSVAEGTSADDQHFIGLQLIILALSIIAGLVAGRFLVRNKIVLPIGPPRP
jgi:hypothetical protein